LGKDSKVRETLDSDAAAMLKAIAAASKERR